MPQYTNHSLFNNIFYNNFWPDIFFVNDYSVLVILWNILLLAIPFFLCKYLIKYYKKNKFKKYYHKIFAVLLNFLWLLFIPNTAYVITDVRHLSTECAVNSAYHVCLKTAWIIMFFFVYGCIGWISFVFLLNQMKGFIIKFSGKKNGKIFIWIIIPLISMGVLLGLINRWNSWDFFLHPILVLKSSIIYLINFIYFKNWAVFTIGLYILYFAGNKIAQRKTRNP
ncbi:MAG: DUF1361 domain-containing protein [Patescibacteria group bacterium]|nr:DUF1361 domain-containing protein [Patescibacteria group bacterium]